MTTNLERLDHLFIVRIWQEPEQVKSGGWRGSAEHIPSGQRMYFVSLNDLNDFIQLRLNSMSKNLNRPTME